MVIKKALVGIDSGNSAQQGMEWYRPVQKRFVVIQASLGEGGTWPHPQLA